MDKMYLYILLIGCVSCFDLPADWINPSDLHHSRKVGDLFAERKVPSETENLPPEKEVPADESKSVLQNATSICPPQVQSACDSYLKRMLNKLLLKTTMKNYRLPEADKRIVMITLYFTSKNLEILHAYASSESYETFSWSDFDQAFSSLFEVPEITVPTEESTAPEQDNALLIFVSIVGSMLIIGLWIFLKSGSFFKAFWVMVVLNFCYALVWNLFKAYNKEKQKILQSLGKDQKISSWWESIESYFWENKQDVLLPQNHPMFNIDFGEIVVETLCTVFHFLPILGEKSGDMLAKFFGSQNWFIRWIVQPILLVLNPVMILILILPILLVMKGFTIKLPFFTLATNKSSEPQHKKVGAQPQRQQQIASAYSPHVAAIQEEFIMAGHSRGPVRLKRADSYIVDEPPLGSTNQRLPALTCSRKGRIYKRRHTWTVLASRYHKPSGDGSSTEQF